MMTLCPSVRTGKVEEAGQQEKTLQFLGREARLHPIQLFQRG